MPVSDRAHTQSRLCRSPDRAHDLAVGFILLWETTEETFRSHPVLGGDAGTIMLAVKSRTRRGRRYDHAGGHIPYSAGTPVRSCWRSHPVLGGDVGTIGNDANSMGCLPHLFRIIFEQFLPGHQDRLWLANALAEAAAYHAQKRLSHPDLSIVIALKHFPRAKFQACPAVVA